MIDTLASADQCQPHGHAADELPKVVRFWVWHTDGYVRLTVRNGQSLTWVSRGPTDEGWSERGEIWRYDDGVLVNESWTDGRDCDGRFATGDEFMCPWTDLAAHVTPDKVGTPKWTRLRAGQRDYSAEAMGY
jgi:hypothetical protein